MTRALVLDCDGVLADTERFGHLPAFNQAFAEFGVPVRWTEDEYGALTKVGGGKERMRAALASLPRFAMREELVAKLHRRKTEIFAESVAAGRIPPRPGVARLVEAALAHGWELAVASTSAQKSVSAVLERAVGPETASRFRAILAGDVVANKKPAPDIYRLALARLGADARDTVVIEDSSIGHYAAVGAGLTTLITVSDYTRDELFADTPLVVSCLGDPDGEQATVLHSGIGGLPESVVTVSTLEACLDWALRRAAP